MRLSIKNNLCYGEIPKGYRMTPLSPLDYLNIIRHFIYARIDASNINYEFLYKFSVETREVLEKVVREKNTGSKRCRLKPLARFTYIGCIIQLST